MVTVRQIKQDSGFTLIELLVVVAIIALLAGVVLASLTTARARGRDAKRVSDLHQFQIALDLYYSTNGSYPLETCDPQPPNVQGWAGNYSGSNDYVTCQTDLQTKLSPYISKLPLDPLNTGTDTIGLSNDGYHYWYASVKNGQGYVLATHPEVSNFTGDAGCFASYWYCKAENWP